MDLSELINEVETYLDGLNVAHEGEHLWSNYEQVVNIALRLQEIHNQLAIREIQGEASAEEKKFRTLVVDHTIDRLDRLAAYESRKLTAKKIEFELGLDK